MERDYNRNMEARMGVGAVLSSHGNRHDHGGKEMKRIDFATKIKTIDSYTVWMNELKQMVEAAERCGVPKSWSEDFIISMLPAVFREGVKDV